MEAQVKTAVPKVKPGRIPVSGFVGAYAAKLAGIPLETFYSDIDTCLRVQQLARDLHGYDEGFHYGWADWGAWEFGGTVHLPQSYKESSPRTATHIVQKPTDVDRLAVPDSETAGMYPLLMEFNRRIVAMGHPAKIQGGSPTLNVAALIGKQNLMRWLIREPSAVKIAYEKATDFIIKAAEMTVNRFGPNCSAGFSAALDTNDLISPDLFFTFTFPCMQTINTALMRLGIDHFHMHLCGNHGLNLPLWTQLPWPEHTVFSFGKDMDIEQVAEAFNHKFAMAGNVDTTLLAHGSYDDVFQDTRRALNQGGKLPGGFILMPGCEMPVMAPPLNVHAMVLAVKQFNHAQSDK